MRSDTTILYLLIVGCEAAFWLVLALALAARYLLERTILSRALLLSLPVIDLLLLAFTTVDLKSGTAATFAHGLATAYVAFTVAFGSVLVRWADDRFAHRFAAVLCPSSHPHMGGRRFAMNLDSGFAASWHRRSQSSCWSRSSRSSTTRRSRRLFTHGSSSPLAGRSHGLSLALPGPSSSSVEGKPNP